MVSHQQIYHRRSPTRNLLYVVGPPQIVRYHNTKVLVAARCSDHVSTPVYCSRGLLLLTCRIVHFSMLSERICSSHYWEIRIRSFWSRAELAACAYNFTSSANIEQVECSISRRSAMRRTGLDSKQNPVVHHSPLDLGRTLPLLFSRKTIGPKENP